MIKTTVTGEAMVFRKDFNDRAAYQVQLSKKDKDGNWHNAFIGIQFKKGVDLANKTKIEINHAWLDFYEKKDGSTEKYIFCNEFEQLSGIPSGFEEIPEGFQALEDDDSIPF